MHPKLEDDIPVLERNLNDVVLPEEGIFIRRRLSIVPTRIPKTILASLSATLLSFGILGEGEGGSSSIPPVVFSPSVLLARISKANRLLVDVLSAMTASPSASNLISSLLAEALFDGMAPALVTKLDLLAFRSVVPCCWSMPAAEDL